MKQDVYIMKVNKTVIYLGNKLMMLNYYKLQNNK